MQEIIAIRPTTIDGQSINTVNARDLHAFLEVGKDFSTWIKVQIERARLSENRDYVIFTQKGEYRKPLTEYAFTLDAAKHIAMMSGTDKGFAVRDYFIECERIAKQPVDPTQLLNDPAAMRGLLLTYTEKVIALEEEKKVLAPKAAALDRISTADGYLCITDSAKALQIRPKDLFSWMSENWWIYRRAGGSGWISYQQRIKQGLLSHKITVVERSDGTQKTCEQVLVTPKGLARLSQVFTQEEVAA